jgi:hypothetical protein
MWKSVNIASAGELHSFFEAWKDMMLAIDRVRRRHQSEIIQNPKLPSAISEALAARIYAAQNATETGILRRGGGADLVATSSNAVTKIEVKGSGTAEFQTIGPKDRACDLLMWLRFGDVTKLDLNSHLNWTLFRPKNCVAELFGSRLNFSTLRANEAGVAAEGAAKISEVVKTF